MGEEALPQGWVQVCSSEAWVQAGLPRVEDQRMVLDLEVAAADHDLCSVMQQKSKIITGIILCETIKKQIKMSIMCYYDTKTDTVGK